MFRPSRSAHPAYFERVNRAPTDEKAERFAHCIRRPGPLSSPTPGSRHRQTAPREWVSAGHHSLGPPNTLGSATVSLDAIPRELSCQRASDPSAGQCRPRELRRGYPKPRQRRLRARPNPAWSAARSRIHRRSQPSDSNFPRSRRAGCTAVEARARCRSRSADGTRRKSSVGQQTISTTPQAFFFFAGFEAAGAEVLYSKPGVHTSTPRTGGSRSENPSTW